MTLTVGSLFSGIGGLDLGLERAGMRVIWQSEIEPYCCKVLAKHWPTIPNLGDVKAIDWSEIERPDVICGGYPCQPFSLAGTRSGEDDARHLWPYMVGAIRVLRPRFAVMENVPGHLSLGFGRVLGDLAESGYDTEWDCVPAAAVGAPHRRDRVFIVAYANSGRCRQRDKNERRISIADPLSDVSDSNAEWTGQPLNVIRGGTAPLVADDGAQGNVAATERVGPQRCEDSGSREGLGQTWHQSSRSRAEIGDYWRAEPDVGRVADGVPSRVDRLRGLGNAVVPQVAQFIGEQLMEALAL